MKIIFHWKKWKGRYRERTGVPCMGLNLLSQQLLFNDTWTLLGNLNNNKEFTNKITTAYKKREQQNLYLCRITNTMILLFFPFQSNIMLSLLSHVKLFVTLLILAIEIMIFFFFSKEIMILMIKDILSGLKLSHST